MTKTGETLHPALIGVFWQARIVSRVSSRFSTADPQFHWVFMPKPYGILSGFGTFCARERKARHARNPQTGETAKAPQSAGTRRSSLPRRLEMLRSCGSLTIPSALTVTTTGAFEQLQTTKARNNELIQVPIGGSCTLLLFGTAGLRQNGAPLGEAIIK